MRIWIIWLLGISALASGQGNGSDHAGRARNTVQLSYGGAGVHFSIICERLLVSRPAWNVGVKTGLGTSISPALSPPEFTVPLGGYILYGKGNSKLDMGLSLTGYLMWQYAHEMERRFMEFQPLIIPSLAYRYQKNEGGFMFRAGLSSILHINGISATFAPWVDLGVGYAF